MSAVSKASSSSNVVSEIPHPLCIKYSWVSSLFPNHWTVPDAAAGAKKKREILRICSKLAPFRLSLMPYPSTLYAILSRLLSWEFHQNTQIYWGRLRLCELCHSHSAPYRPCQYFKMYSKKGGSINYVCLSLRTGFSLALLKNRNNFELVAIIFLLKYPISILENIPGVKK